MSAAKEAKFTAPSGPLRTDNMRAILLVGGFGTRLRPFTFTAPKPLVPFCNKAILTHQIEALVKVGVKEIVLAVSQQVQPQVMLDFLKASEEKYKIKIHCSPETTPMGTGGPLALARKYLAADNSPFFMLNSDVICEFPLKKMLEFHLAHGGEGTILVTEVKDPSKYGVILYDEKGAISQFIEKPAVFVSNKINAGIYLLNPKMLERVELRPTSIEREIFPAMAIDKTLYCMVLPGYWMDIGQPKDFITGTGLHLDYLKRSSPAELADGKGKEYTIKGNVLIDPSAKIGRGSEIGPDVVLGPGTVVGDGVRLSKCTLLEGAVIKNSAFVSGSIVGWQSTIGEWARVEGTNVGEDVQIAREIAVLDSSILPHKGVSASVTNQIVM